MDDQSQQVVQGQAVQGDIPQSSVVPDAVVSQPAGLVQPVTTSGVHKEQAPTASVHVIPETTATPSQELTHSEPEPILHPEVEQAGVTVVKQVPDLKLEDQKAGLSHAPAIAPIPTQPINTVQYPMTYVQAEQIIKTHPVKDSIRWIAVMVEKLIKSEKKPK